MFRPPLHPRISTDPFVGYLDTPEIDRRFLLGLSAAGLLGASALTAVIAGLQRGAGRGDWDMRTRVSFSGIISTAPYPHIRVMESGRVRTILLGCETKCGVRERLDAITYAGGAATVTGTLIERDGYAMLAVPDGVGWLDFDQTAPALPQPQLRMLDAAVLTGEILDAKCWFGAMRPNEGLSHKACATLCIASGIPPYFGVRDRRNRERALMITDTAGDPLIDGILPFVAEPVRAQGALVHSDDLIQFRMDPETLERV